MWVLEKYYTDFPIYNPYLEQLPAGSPRMTNGKLMPPPPGNVGMMQTGNNGQINVNGQNMTTINQPAGRNNFKYYDMDGVGLGPIPEKVRLLLFYTKVTKRLERSFICFSRILKTFTVCKICIKSADVILLF